MALMALTVSSLSWNAPLVNLNRPAMRASTPVMETFEEYKARVLEKPADGVQKPNRFLYPNTHKVSSFMNALTSQNRDMISMLDVAEDLALHPQRVPLPAQIRSRRAIHLAQSRQGDQRVRQIALLPPLRRQPQHLQVFELLDRGERT